ncbi:MAG: PilZ domain-containing protein [Acidobacteriia bacterium]|nr:PilZ domain-containing protein [Terriglobia bacterium]
MVRLAQHQETGGRGSVIGQRLSATFVTFRESLRLNTLVPWGSSLMAIQAVPPQPAQATGRRFPRYKTDVPVQVVTHGPTNVIMVQGRGSDLNCGGMAVSGRVELEIGAQVAVEFTPPCSGQPLRVRCFVRNRQRYTYGLEFITENDSDYESIAQVESSLENMGIGVCSKGDCD